eukprot:612747-Amphidinium_carterae.1
MAESAAATAMEEQEDGALELGVPAPGASNPPQTEAPPGEGADKDAMEVVKERKRIRGCIDNGEDPLEAPFEPVAVAKKKRGKTKPKLEQPSVCTSVRCVQHVVFRKFGFQFQSRAIRLSDLLCQ